MRRRQVIELRSGLKLEVDLEGAVQQTLFWYDGDMEPQLSWAVREFLPVGGTLIDCGANCGFIGLEARLQKHARVLFVEPHPGLAAGLRRNIQLNGWSDSCTVIQAAASDHPGTAPLFLCPDYEASHSLLADWLPPHYHPETVPVRLTTLRQLMESEPGFRTADFLKIDAEGHDRAILQGLGDWLAPDRIPLLYVELGRDRAQASGLLQERGYAGFAYRPHHSARELRRAVRHYAEGEAVAFYWPLEQCGDGGETLWCPQGGVQEAFLRELVERQARGVF